MKPVKKVEKYPKTVLPELSYREYKPDFLPNF